MAKKSKLVRKYQEGGNPPRYISANKNTIKNPILTDDLTYQISVPDELVRGWHLNYINSPKYKERLIKMGYVNPDKVIKDRTKRIKDTNIVSSDGLTQFGSYYDQMNGANTIYMEYPQAKELNTFREDILAHELGHVNNSSTNIKKDKNGKVIKMSPSNTSLSEREEEYIASRNKSVGNSILNIVTPSIAKKNSTYSNVLSSMDHDWSPAENKSDIDALRYILEKEGLYKAGTQDFTPEMLEKAKNNKAIQRSFNAGRVFKKFDDQDIIDIMNDIAMNNTQNTPVARYGGTIPSPRMGSGNKTYPYKRKLRPGTPPAKMQAGGPVDPLDQEVLDWTKSYIASPKYKQRLSNFYKYPDYIQRQRSAQVSETKFNPAGPTTSALQYYPVDNDITIGPAGLTGIKYENPKADPNLLRQQVVAHELGHATTSGERPGSNLSPKEQAFILNRNIQASAEERAKLLDINTPRSFKVRSANHDLLPTESKADIDATRFLLNRAGIYDARTQDFTPELLKKAKENKAFQTSPVFKRLQENFSDQGIIDILNKVAYNNENDNPMVAKNGGLSRDKDYGSKKKPYPSVSKGDFAGGGRSYPIPTKADAIDALRLAGLHGRSDVRAKVFKKYPELKKELGGEIFVHDANKVQNIWYPKLKAELGVEVYADGGPIDPNDPEFGQKIQELLRTNPELAQDIFSPATDINPPGAGQEISTLQSDPNKIYPFAPSEEEIAMVDKNTNAQQNKPKSNKPKVNFPSINVGDAISMGVQGLDLLATEYIDAPRRRANEMRLLRQQLAPVISRPSTGGFDMPVLAKSGIQITSAYTDPVGLPSPTKPKKPFGNVANNFKVDDPEFANVLAEGGEFLELPDGQTSNITGDLHSDYSGGEFMNLPEGAKIYSDSIKVDKTFQKDLTGSKSGKKKTVAQIAKKFNTDHEEDILKDPTADTISKRSANIMKTFKQSQLQQLFDYQESVKDPLYMINKEQGAQDYMGSEDQVVAKRGVKVMQEGGKPPIRRRRPVGVLAPENQTTFYTIQNGQPVATTGITPDPTPTTQQPLWWQNIRGVQGGPPPAVNIQGQMAMLEQPTSTPKYTTPDSTPNSTPTPGINTIGTTLDPVSGVRGPDLQVAVPPVTIPLGEPIDPNKFRKPMPDNNKVNPPRPNPKVPWSNTLNSFGEIVPELAAYIQNETDFPVFTARYQPRYLNPVELNIQASLNRNYAQTAPLLEGSSGNPSIDNARASQALANLYDANNEAFQQKFNFDTQNRYQTDAANLQIENQANLLNLQRADDYWNKITARQAVKEATRNNIMNSAYAKFKRKQLENRSLQLTNQMFDNFKYDPEQGIYFTPSGDQYIFHEPSGNFINIGTTPGDGIETTRTVRNTPKGTTTTLRQKEKRGS